MKKNNANPLLNNQNGFSMMEIVIVVGIIMGLLAFIGPKIADGIKKSSQNKTKMILSEVSMKIDEYYSECGKYPASLTFLVDDDSECRSWTGNPKMKHLMKDDFKNDLVYEPSGRGYILKSLGADKKDGGKSYDKDIFSENSENGGDE
jgi:general secretion pathway protein G